MSKFFIDRPVFAWVIALVIMLAGSMSILKLPINQYPNIAAPAISISVMYPGASAQMMQDTVVQVIEQQLNGLDGLRYISSSSNSDGSMEITITFEQGVNPDIAQVQVQNKLDGAKPLLPQEVQQQGIRVTKSVRNFLMVVGLISPDRSMDQNDIADYIMSNIKDPLSRTSGVGDYQIFGAQYAMRIWLDPSKLHNFQLTPVDVKRAIQAQNIQVSAGKLGGLPAIEGQQLTATIIGKTRLTDVEQFKAILLKVNADGSQVRLSDVARVELGGEYYGITALYNGMPASGIAIKLASGANALDTSKAVRETIAQIEPFMPQGLEVIYPMDSTPVIAESINGVVKTLFEAIGLVFIVMFLFLQSFRITLIPTLAVPVVLLGTFGVLNAFGFSINTLTMFAMVLAIGLLVDDAIVVVENVERVMREDGLSPYEATRKSMGQVQGALIGIALVLSAVFLPMAFFAGSTGVIYRQFSIAIVSAMMLSVLVALVFTPALCVTLLKPVNEEDIHNRGFFGWFNRTFNASSKKYQNGVRYILQRKIPFLLVYAVLIGGLIFLFMRIPTSFLPEEDQNILFAQVMAPSGSSAERTQQTLDGIREYLLAEEKAVDAVFTINGFNFSGRGQNTGMAFIKLKEWKDRKDPNDAVHVLAHRVQMRLFGFRDAMAFVFAPPAVMEMGNATGFNLYLQDKAGIGMQALGMAGQQFMQLANEHPALFRTRVNGMPPEPQYQLLIDEERASTLGLTLAEINETLSIAWGGIYINDFIDRGRVKKVYMQGEANSRMNPEDFDKWHVRNREGKMVPFSSFASGSWTYGPSRLDRYNGLPALEIVGEPAPGHSSGEAMAAVAEIINKMPPGVGYAWTGLSFEERLSGAQAPILYAISVLVVFLCLAALYESWSIPFAVIMVVPLGILGALLFTIGRGLSNDVFFQVGLLTTIGLSSRNAILIVEFAKAQHKLGMSYAEAAIEACRMRLRPIVMTSFAFIFGVLPLAIATGAGAGSKQAIGTGVIGGMLSALFLAIFWIPLFYVVICSWFESKTGHD